MTRPVSFESALSFSSSSPQNAKSIKSYVSEYSSLLSLPCGISSFAGSSVNGACRLSLWKPLN